MNRNLYTSIIIHCFITLSAFSQELYMPVNILDAYKNGTRSYDGIPGDNYFQNRSEYSIKAEFDPESGKLKGKEWITYYNNSPDFLYELVFRLYQDLFKKGNMRDVVIDPSDIHDGTAINKIMVNDSVMNLTDGIGVTREGTNMVIRPGFAVNPGQSVRIFINWEITLPLVTNIRFGSYNNSSFLIAYWYPQIAVYDDIDGWDLLNFNGVQEFYNDFNEYSVEIKVPFDYMVWATGIWDNPGDILKPEYLSRYYRSFQSEEVIHIISDKDSYPVSLNRKYNTFEFTAKNVSDFTFAVSNEYLWDAVCVKPEKNTDSVVVHAVYPKNSKYFHKVADIEKEAVRLLSDSVFEFPFPFSKVTAFNGEGGMEFPMMMNNGDRPGNKGTVAVTTHEMCHMYFPFLVGTNEKKYAWMDEGLVTMLAHDANIMLVTGPSPYYGDITIFSSFSGNEQEIPMMFPSNLLSSGSYQIHAYFRPATAFFYLREYLGTVKFKKAITDFTTAWQKKHPIPYDLFFTFNRSCSENLDWFWNAWFFKPGYTDLFVEKAVYHNGFYDIKIKNEGGLPVPFSIRYLFEDGSVQSVKIPLSTWKDDLYHVSVSKETNKLIKEIFIEYYSIPDVNTMNNNYVVTNK